MHPVGYVSVPERRLALGDLILMMGEDVVDAAGVDVDTRPQVLGRHRRALDMPAGEAVTPRAGPDQLPARLSRLPEGEVPLVPLERVGLHADSLLQAAADLAGQLAVLGEAVDGEVDVAARLVGELLLHERPRQLYHVLNGLAGAGEDVRGQDIELLLVFQECGGVEAGDLRRRLPFGQGGGDHLILAALQHLLSHVSHIGDVLNVAHAIAAGLQKASQPIGDQVGAEVADVGMAVHRGSTGVNLYQPRLQRRERFLAACESVVQAEDSPLSAAGVRARPSPGGRPAPLS